MATASCATCVTTFEIEGAKALCPTCGKPGEIDLSVRVICSCGTTLKAPHKMRGRVVKCPKCTRSVHIPRGDEEDQARASTIVGRLVRWIFALSLVPILIASEDTHVSTVKRVGAQIKNLGDKEKKAAAEEATTQKAQLVAIGGKATGAWTQHGSFLPYALGGLALAGFLGFVLWAFKALKSSTYDIAVNCAILFVLGTVVNLGINLAMPIPATGETGGRAFMLAILAALIAEPIKGYLIARKLQTDQGLSWKFICLLGIVGGLAYGAAEAIQYAMGQLNGVGYAGSYVVAFISMVGLQGAWGGASATFLWRNRDKVRSTDWMGPYAMAIAPSIVLHFLFDLVHRQDQQMVAIFVGLASFGLFHAYYWWGENTEDEILGAQTIKL